MACAVKTAMLNNRKTIVKTIIGVTPAMPEPGKCSSGIRGRSR
jgi:hypothetical protein